MTGDDEVWGVDFNAQLVQRHVYILERSPVLDMLVGDRSMKMTDDGWVMVWEISAVTYSNISSIPAVFAASMYVPWTTWCELSDPFWTLYCDNSI